MTPVAFESRVMRDFATHEGWRDRQCSSFVTSSHSFLNPPTPILIQRGDQAHRRNV
jgi:hypothetical protein